MIKSLCSFMFLNHDKCKHEVHTLKTDSEKKIQSLEFEIIQLINQIQELKAINHYQAFELELKINTLQEENRLLKDEIEAHKTTKGQKAKRTTCAASDGNVVEIIDHGK